MQNPPQINFYVDLDALLDTRLGVLSSLDEEAAASLDLTKYRERISDQFKHLGLSQIDDDVYRTAYRKRTADVLPHAMMTPVSLYLNIALTELEKEAMAGSPLAGPAKLTINLWPYKDLTPPEIEAICAAMFHRSGVFTSIETICESPKIITTDFIAYKQWNMMFMYGFWEWFEYQWSRWTQKPRCIPNTVIVAPQLAPTLEGFGKALEYKNPKGEIADPFECVRVLAAEVIGLAFADVKVFSIVELPEYDDEYEPSDPSIVHMVEMLRKMGGG